MKSNKTIFLATFAVATITALTSCNQRGTTPDVPDTPSSDGVQVIIEEYEDGHLRNVREDIIAYNGDSNGKDLIQLYWDRTITYEIGKEIPMHVHAKPGLYLDALTYRYNQTEPKEKMPIDASTLFASRALGVIGRPRPVPTDRVDPALMKVWVSVNYKSYRDYPFFVAQESLISAGQTGSLDIAGYHRYDYDTPPSPLVYSYNIQVGDQAKHRQWRLSHVLHIASSRDVSKEAIDNIPIKIDGRLNGYLNMRHVYRKVYGNTPSEDPNSLVTLPAHFRKDVTTKEVTIDGWNLPVTQVSLAKSTTVVGSEYPTMGNKGVITIYASDMWDESEGRSLMSTLPPLGYNGKYEYLGIFHVGSPVPLFFEVDTFTEGGERLGLYPYRVNRWFGNTTAQEGTIFKRTELMQETETTRIPDLNLTPPTVR